MSLSISQRRTVIRSLHLAVSLPLGAMIYAPVEIVELLRPVAQIVIFPVLTTSGLWMWQGHRLRRLLKQVSPAVPTA